MATTREWTFFESVNPWPRESVPHTHGKKRTNMRTLIIYGAYVTDMPEGLYEAFEVPLGEKLKDFIDSNGYYADENVAGFLSCELSAGDTWSSWPSSVAGKEAATSWARLRSIVEAETGFALPTARLIVAVVR